MTACGLFTWVLRQPVTAQAARSPRTHDRALDQQVSDGTTRKSI